MSNIADVTGPLRNNILDSSSTSKTPILCTRCSSLVIEIPGPEIDHRTKITTPHTTVQESIEGASHGCEFCTSIVENLLGALPLTNPTGIPTAVPSIQKADITVYGKPPLMDIMLEADVAMKDMRIFTLPDDPLATVLSSRPFTSGPSSAEIYQLVKVWIDDCINHHEGCPRPQDTELPTRVLDVGNIRSKNVSLYVPRDHNISIGQYVALSYCWGTTPCVRTTSDTLQEHKRCIPFLALPGTIQDATCVTRNLGIRYLWVDALCIIQGADELARQDWEQESTKMNSVYGNSYVTLGAAGSGDCQNGMFLVRPPRKKPPFRFQARCGNTRGHVYFEEQQEHFILSDDEPIDLRAWTLQERLISPRFVKYGTYAVSWECRTICHAEFEQNIDTERAFKYYKLPSLVTIEDWMSVIEDYSARELTVEDDRFPAIAGVAQRFHADLQLCYLAGLWESKHDQSVLLRGLLWCFIIETVKHWESPTFHHAPSWSWASISCPVTWAFPPLQYVFGTDPGREFRAWHSEILGTDVELASSNPFGKVKEAHIAIRGPLKQIEALQPEGGDQIYILDLAQGVGERKVGIAAFDGKHLAPFTFDDGKWQPERIVHGKSNDSIPLCLHIADVKMGHSTEDVAPCGLLVVPISTQPHHFRRVGVFCLWDYVEYCSLEASWLSDGIKTEIVLI